MFNKGERRALDILDKTSVKNGNFYEEGLLWKNEETKLPHSRDLAVNRLKSAENNVKIFLFVFLVFIIQ